MRRRLAWVAIWVAVIGSLGASVAGARQVNGLQHKAETRDLTIAALVDQLNALGETPKVSVPPEVVQGAPGAQGERGPQGDPGATGPEGRPPNGSEIATAVEDYCRFDVCDGPVGPQGEAGSPGTNGSQGTPGAQGAQGPTGPAGATGAPGAQGPAGTDGAPGADGAQGAQGDPGAQGPQGPSPSSFTIHVGALIFTCLPTESDPTVFDCRQ